MQLNMKLIKKNVKIPEKNVNQIVVNNLGAISSFPEVPQFTTDLRITDMYIYSFRRTKINSI